MNEQYIWFKGKRKLFSDMSLEEQDDFWNDIDNKANKNKEDVRMKLITEKEYQLLYIFQSKGFNMNVKDD